VPSRLRRGQEQFTLGGTRQYSENQGTAHEISMQRATSLMGISLSWSTLASQLDRLAIITKNENN
jgi:hypothetical protein